MKRTLADFARACSGRLLGADREYSEVVTDTRTIAPGELFVALHGPRFDGNDFVAAAAAAGAVGAVVDRENTPATIARILVADTQSALVAAARAWRGQFHIPLVGVAGSNGKTTVKEMIAGILAQAGATHATRGNLNNHIGVPLTLMRLTASHRYAVIEMGANRAGEVAELVRIAQPGIGIVTNAGAEHLEGFGSLEGVARAEGEMFAGLAADGIAVVNADDEFAPLWRGMTRAQVRTFGVQNAADFRAQEVSTGVDADGATTRFAMISPLGRAQIELRLAGMHNVVNALGAAAAATAAGATLDQVAGGLAAMRAVAGRLQFKLARCGAGIIDDSYNANPSSMRAGLDVLAQYAGRKWLVLGEMAELGAYTDQSHADIGRYARERGVERLFGLGKAAAITAETFGSGAQWFADGEALVRGVSGELEREGPAAAGIRVLIKGSRSNRLERVVSALVDPEQPHGARRAG